MTGTTKRSLRIVTNSSCSTPSSRCARRKRSSDSWIAFFCRSISRRSRPKATLAWSETVPSGSILPSRSLSSARKSPIFCALRPRRVKRSEAAVSTDLASAARSSSNKTSKISFGSRLAPSIRNLCTAASRSGSPLKSTRIAAPRAAGCGRAASLRYSTASPVSARSSRKRAMSPCGWTFSNSRRPRGLDTKRPTNWRNGSYSRTSALVFTWGRSPASQAAPLVFSPLAKAFFNYPQSAFGNPHRLQVAPPHPLRATHVIARSQPPAAHPADIIDEHVMILGGAFGVTHDAFENRQHVYRFHFQPGLLPHLATNSIFQQFACLNQPSRNRPPALQRFAASFDHQDTVPLVNQRTDAQQRMPRVAPLFFHWAAG